MHTTEKIFHWAGIFLLTTALLLNLFKQLEAPSVVRMMTTGLAFYAVALNRYTGRLRAENKALQQHISVPQT